MELTDKDVKILKTIAMEIEKQHQISNPHYWRKAVEKDKRLPVLYNIIESHIPEGDKITEWWNGLTENLRKHLLVEYEPSSLEYKEIKVIYDHEIER